MLSSRQLAIVRTEWQPMRTPSRHCRLIAYYEPLNYCERGSINNNNNNCSLFTKKMMMMRRRRRPTKGYFDVPYHRWMLQDQSLSFARWDTGPIIPQPRPINCNFINKLVKRNMYKDIALGLLEGVVANTISWWPVNGRHQLIELEVKWSAVDSTAI